MTNSTTWLCAGCGDLLRGRGRYCAKPECRRKWSAQYYEANRERLLAQRATQRRAAGAPAGRGCGGKQLCELCGGPLRSDALYGVCRRNPECKLELGRRSKPVSAARRRSRDEENFLTRVCLRSAKYRARKSGHAFGLTVDDLPPIPEFCPVLGIKLQRGGQGAERNDSPSLDRLVPELGYVPGNVQWISHRANMLRRDATAAELRLVAAYAEAIEGGEFIGAAIPRNASQAQSSAVSTGLSA